MAPMAEAVQAALVGPELQASTKHRYVDGDIATEGALIGDIPEPPKLVEQSKTVRHNTVSNQVPAWLHTHLRNMIALGLTGMVGWLALSGSEDAMTALIAAFSLLMGALWGER